MISTMKLDLRIRCIFCYLREGSEFSITSKFQLDLVTRSHKNHQNTNESFGNFFNNFYEFSGTFLYSN